MGTLYPLPETGKTDCVSRPRQTEGQEHLLGCGITNGISQGVKPFRGRLYHILVHIETAQGMDHSTERIERTPNGGEEGQPVAAVTSLASLTATAGPRHFAGTGHAACRSTVSLDSTPSFNLSES